MGRHPDFVPQGVIPAVLLPFHEDLSIDETSFRAHLRDVAAVRGLSAITINAHSTEVASCTSNEQRRIMEIAYEEVGATLPIIHGGPTAAWRRRASRVRRRRAEPQRCWCSLRLRLRFGSHRKWCWLISRLSAMPAICR